MVTPFVTCLLMAPAVGLLLLAQALGYGGTPEMTLRRSWLTIAALPPGTAVVFALLGAIGRLSGYRPFRQDWKNLPASEATTLSASIKRSAEQTGFISAWVAANRIDFVSVRNIELEMAPQWMRSGKDFPMRLSCFTRETRPGRVDLVMRLANRTVVLWDTGERDACRRIGRDIVALAAASSSQLSS